MNKTVQNGTLVNLKQPVTILKNQKRANEKP